MNDTLLDSLVTEIPWSRPPYRLGDLSKPEGNALIVLWNIKKCLANAGQPFEEQEIDTLTRVFGTLDYNKNLDTANHFVNIEPAEEYMGEDDDFVYIKLKKSEAAPNAHHFRFDTKQTSENWNIHRVALHKKSNRYGRNPAFYADTPEKVAILVEENISLLKKDFMGATHGILGRILPKPCCL